MGPIDEQLAVETWREKWGRAVRLVTRMGAVEKQLRAELAAIKKGRAAHVAHKAVMEGEILALKKERDGLQEALRSTTVDLNRYFEELTKLREDLTTEGHGKARKEEGEKKVGRPLPSGDVLAQVFWNGFESIRPHESRLTYSKIGLETHRHIEEGIQFVLFALGPHLRPADETAETLRGRLRQVMASLDEEKAGRLRAETRVQELETALTSAHAEHGERLHEQAGRYEVKLSDLRSNHQNEIAGLQGMLADAERRIAAINATGWKELHHEGHEEHEGGKEKALSAPVVNRACGQCLRAFADGEVMFHRIVGGVGAGYVCGQCMNKLPKEEGVITANAESVTIGGAA